jgi:hypothetical protein
VAGVVISAAEVNVHGLGPVQGEIACRRSMMPSNKPNRHRTFGTKRSVTIEQGKRAEREAGEEAVSRFLQLVSEGRDKIEPRWFRTVSWPREGSRPDVVSRPEGTSGKHGWVTRRSRAPEPSGNQMAQMSSVRGWVVHSSDDVSEGGSLSWHLMIVTPDGQLLSVGGSGSTSPPEDDPIVVGGPPVDLGQRNQWWKVPEYLAATAVAMGIFPPSR